MAFLGLDPGDPNNWYQSPRSNMCGVWFAPDDPYLPPPWKGVIDGNTRRLYYWNLETNITQYEKPAYWVQSSCSPPSFYHSPVTASSDYTCPSQYPNLHPQYQRPAETVINGFKFPQQFPFPNPTNTSTSQPIYPQSNSLVEPIYPNFRSFQPEHDLNPSIPIFQSPPVPTFLPQTQFLNLFPSFGVGSSNAPTTTTAASPPSLDSTPSQSLTSGSNSSPFGPPVSAAISGTTSSSSSQPPISDVPEQNEVPHSKLAVSTLMDELQKPRQFLSVAIAEEVNLAVQVDHSSSGRNSDAKLKSDNVIPSNGVDLTVLDANLTAIQLLQDLTDEDTVDENDEPPPILVNGFVDDNQPGGTTYLQCPPQVSLSSVEITVSSINALECHPLSVVRIDECLPWLDFVLIVEKNFVLMVEKNENFSSRSPAMNSVNRLETIEDAGELFLIMPERNIVSWKTLISALVLNGQEEKALGVYDTMISEGMVPTHFSLATLFGACKGWLDVEKGIELNVILYNTLLLLGADIGYTDQAIKIVEDVKSSETWKPDSWTFSSMMTIYSCSGKVSEARRTLNEMMEAGFQLNILILISLIQFYGKAKRTDDVVEAFNQLQQLGITPDEHFCGYLLNVMTQTPKGELPELNDCIKRGNEKLGYVVRPLVGKQDSSQNFRKEASELFNSVGSDMKAYYNCFISLRVNLQLLKRACEFLNLGLTLEIYTDIQSKYPTQWSLYLKGLSVGAVFTALHVWINDLSRSLESGEKLLILFGINTENGQTKAISQTRSFSIEVIDFLKVNSVFSSSRYTYGPVVSMITVVSQSVVHLIFHAWLLLIHAHKHNIGKRTSLVTLPYFALGTASHVLEYLNVIFVNVLTHKKGAIDVICHATIFYVEFVFFLHMQMVEKLMPSPIVEFPGHSMTRKEIVTFWIWLPTTLLHLQTKVILLENTYTGAYFQVTFVLGNVNDDFHMVYSTICCLLLFNFEIPHVVVSRYWRLDYISECNLLIIDNEPAQSVLTMICKGAAKQSKADKLMFFHFDLVGSIPTEPLDHSDSKPLNCRYDAQISVFRSKPQQKLGDAKVFMIGSGTLECELLKHVTLMGASCGNQGKRAIIDDDVIEKSNPSKQIIFRDRDIGWAKSTVAASTAASINRRPRLDIVAFYNRVRPETENVFDDTIWGSPSVDLNAVHNVNGKLYVGQRSSKFLLNWLVQPEHEHRKWFAAISVRLISSGLHITDHKQMLEKCLRVVKSTLDVLHIMQKSGIKQNYQSFLQSYLPYVSVGKAFPSLQHEHHIDPTDVKTVISYVHQQEVPSSYSSVISQEGQHQMERVVTRLNFPTDWKNWQICLLLVGMFLVFAVAFYMFFEKSDNPWNLPLEKYQPARPEFWEIQKLCLLHSFCYYHINAPRHELGADVISSDFSLLNVDDLADQFVALVDFLGLKKVLSLGGDLHDGVGTIWKIIQA